MNIVIVGPAYPYRGGIADFSERLAHEFLHEGHSVRLVTFTLQYPSFLFPGTTQYAEGPAPTDLTITRSLNSVNPISWLRTARSIRAAQPDVVIFAYWMAFMAPAYGFIASRLRRKGIRCVALVHNMLPHERTILDMLFAPYFVRRMDGFSTLSQSVCDDVRSLTKENKPVTLCPHPLYDNFGPAVSREEAIAHLGLDAGMRYILFFGLIRDYKGLDLLMEAFADVRLQARNIRLLVAGEFYSGEERYLELERTLGLQGRIVWTRRFIPSDEVRHYFAAADIVAQPYRTATQSGVTQIAYHFGRPMLVTNVGGLAEIVPDGRVGYVVAPQAQAIADALVDFLDAGREPSFTAATQVEKAKYTWSNMTRALLTAAQIEQ